MLKYILILLAVIGVIFSVAFLYPIIIIGSLVNSHLTANSIPDENIDTVFKRDLTEQFSKKYKCPVDIKIDFLQSYPTQTGVGFPKYYCWVDINKDGKRIDEGAARISGIDKDSVYVNTFMSLSDIKADPQWVYEYFPKSVCLSIFERSNMTPAPMRTQKQRMMAGTCKQVPQPNGYVKFIWRNNDSNLINEAMVSPKDLKAFENYRYNEYQDDENSYKLPEKIKINRCPAGLYK